MTPSLDIEKPFKIVAGPGAGKTYWLVEHIKKTIQESKRLSFPRKIACITYTNTAAEEINTRLDNCQNYVEVYTIHSFLYAYFIKPFLHLIKEIESCLEITNVAGHDQHSYYYSIIKEWLEASGQGRFIGVIPKLYDKLDKVAWNFDNGSYILKPKWFKIGKSNIKKDSYIQLRRLFWTKGKLFHDDVLYFSAKLIEKFPKVLTVIRAKFPYIFIDEFQDTTPIQSKIIKSIGEEETIIGVIGDPAQSIYEFTGASPGELNNFCLQDMQEGKLKTNYRSSPEIIKLLNCIRSDITQKPGQNDSGEQPTILIGTPQQARQHVEIECGEDNVWILGYKQETAMSAKDGFQQKAEVVFPLSNTDSNSDRARDLSAVINAVEYARQKNFKRSFKELEKLEKEKQLDIQEQLDLLSQMIASYDEISKQVMTDFHNTRIQPIFSTAKITSGKTKNFYDSFTYAEYITQIKLEDTEEIFRTIHSTKGAEREVILVIIPDEKNILDILLNPDLENKEPHRVYYVAMSRARKRLFINIPRELTEAERNKVTELDLIIKDLKTQ